jgi:hypothetical protein
MRWRTVGQSHTEWFDPAGRRLGEEWRRWTAERGQGASAGRPAGRRGGWTRADRVADCLMLGVGLLVAAGSLALRALAR